MRPPTLRASVTDPVRPIHASAVAHLSDFRWFALIGKIENYDHSGDACGKHLRAMQKNRHMRTMHFRGPITIVIEPARLDAAPGGELFEEEVDAAFGDLINWAKNKLSPPSSQPPPKKTGGDEPFGVNPYRVPLTFLSPLRPLRRLPRAPPNLEPRHSRNSPTPKKTLQFAQPCSEPIRTTHIIGANTMMLWIGSRGPKAK